MINNLKEALPSSSTKQADVIYECMVEGGITRLMAIYSNYENLEKVGSIRSARHYYINIANEYNAIYVHYGQSKPAKERLDKHVIDNINGLTYDTGFYRDDSRVAPHNAYTSGERIVKGIQDFGYSTEYSDSHEKVLSFNENETELADGQAASKIHVNFSNYSKPYFISRMLLFRSHSMNVLTRRMIFRSLHRLGKEKDIIVQTARRFQSHGRRNRMMELLSIIQKTDRNYY